MNDQNRREFLRLAGASALAGLSGLTSPLLAAPAKTSAPETALKGLFDTLTEEQRKVVCFPWDHIDKKRGLLRTFVANNWQITDKPLISDFYTKKQRDIVHDIFKGLIDPKWYDRFIKQLDDDNDGKPWGSQQSIAIFGQPGDEKFEFVLTGRHQTLRADGNTESHVAFGGPIFYGHAADGDSEKADHPGNVFWSQALAANGVYKLLEPPQREKALVTGPLPREQNVSFTGGKKEARKGIAVSEMSDDQKKEMQKVLAALIEPFRQDDRNEVLACLKKQGGLDACSLAFYKTGDIGGDGVWDNWRLEGPSFVWYFRGSPHVHVWVNIADDAAVKTNAG